MTQASGIVALEMDGWTCSVRTYGDGYEVSITDDRMESKYMRLDAERSETLRQFFAEVHAEPPPAEAIGYISHATLRLLTERAQAGHICPAPAYDTVIPVYAVPQSRSPAAAAAEVASASPTIAHHCTDARYPYIHGIVTTSKDTVEAWRESGIEFEELVPRRQSPAAKEMMPIPQDAATIAQAAQVIINQLTKENEQLRSLSQPGSIGESDLEAALQKADNRRANEWILTREVDDRPKYFARAILSEFNVTRKSAVTSTGRNDE